MKLKLWGVRGSLATPMTTAQLRDKMRMLLAEAGPDDLADDGARQALIERSAHGFTYGGNTSCVECELDGATLVFDAGTGIRALGADLAADGRIEHHDLHVLFTHFHWDHICGFPFFAPIYRPGKRVHLWSGRDDALELLEVQMSSAHFPVKWPSIPAEIVHARLEEGPANPVADAEVRILPMIHPDRAWGYRVDHGGAAFCYLTDTEVSKDPERLSGRYSRFVDGADVVIVDAMYGFLEYHDRINFGHSTIYNWIDFFAGTAIGELVIFHHDPMAEDLAVQRLLASAQRYRELVAPKATWKLTAAAEGRTWEL